MTRAQEGEQLRRDHHITKEFMEAYEQIVESNRKDYGQIPQINGREYVKLMANINIFRNDHGLVIGGPKDCGKTTGILMLTWLASEINAIVRYWIYFKFPVL